jgi:hypothetical protein
MEIRKEWIMDNDEEARGVGEETEVSRLQLRVGWGWVARGWQSAGGEFFLGEVGVRIHASEVGSGGSLFDVHF